MNPRALNWRTRTSKWNIARNQFVDAYRLHEAEKNGYSAAQVADAKTTYDDTMKARYSLFIQRGNVIKARIAATAKIRKATVAEWVAKEVKKAAVRASELTAEEGAEEVEAAASPRAHGAPDSAE